MMVAVKRAFLIIATLAVMAAWATPARAGTPVKISLSATDIASLLIYVAQDKGFFKAAGLDSELVQFQSDTAAAQALTANATQIASSSIFPVFDSYVAGRDLVAIWSIANLSNYVWYGLPKYQTLKDIKGGKVGVASIGAMSYYITTWVMSKAGVSATDVSYIPLGGPINRAAALKAGQVDVIPAAPPGTFQLADDGFKPLFELRSVMPQSEYEVFYVRRSNLARDEALLRSVIGATIRAKHWAMAHPTEANAVLMEHLGAKEEERANFQRIVDDALPFFPENGKFADESIDVFLGFYQQEGKIKTIPEHGAFTDYRFVEYFTKNPVTD